MYFIIYYTNIVPFTRVIKKMRRKRKDVNEHKNDRMIFLMVQLYINNYNTDIN